LAFKETRWAVANASAMGLLTIGNDTLTTSISLPSGKWDIQKSNNNKNIATTIKTSQQQ
jgi:hypothetical protein